MTLASALLTREWADLVTEGIEARRQRDGGQWGLGDLAAQVETTYGGGDLEKYAEEIEVDYDSLREYRRIAKSYENANRFANLSFKHHREIASREDRHDWLSLAADNRWSVGKMLAEIEAEDTREREEAERQRQLAVLAQQNEQLAEQVEAGEIDVKSALAEAAIRHQEAEQERRDREGRIRRNSTSLAACVSYAFEQLSHAESRETLLSLYDAKLSDHRFVVTKKSLQQAAENLSLLAEEWS